MRDNRLPEPAELHAHVSRAHPLDWGDLPTREEIAAQYGADAADGALALLAEAARAEPRVTADVTGSIDDDAFAYHLKNRLKSPQSLARKLKKENRLGPPYTPPEDILRYTVGVDHPDQVVRTARQLVDRMRARGWSMASAHHSYQPGSRYKGLHFFLRGHGQVVELQVHSRQSIAVKEATTRWYEVFRDRDRPKAEKDEALDKCIKYSDPMTQPAGIDALTHLGGVPVEVRGYGRTPARSPRATEGSAAGQDNDQRQEPHRRRNHHGRDEIDR
ncbi:hypothetical protein [Kribbella italica]|uniref:RelA/SpoT domain-containing protein n=1 Tax=Kribbella italica TaxID=1540520 RepID=A0A7W9MUV7_9ACTN|nr:hypothetical protein [Kribbella italica]MBB5837271.1 hypothetical protein [Kribbella italica]